MERYKIDETLTLDANALIIEIGRELAKRDNLASPASDDELLERGEKWWNRFLPRFREFVCPKIEELAKLQDSDERLFVLTVADLVADAIIGVSPFLIGALILKIGIKQICGATKII